MSENKYGIIYKELGEEAEAVQKEMIELQENLKKLRKIQVIHPKHRIKFQKFHK